MNTFYEHHQSSINFAYRCLDRILLNGSDTASPSKLNSRFSRYPPCSPDEYHKSTADPHARRADNRQKRHRSSKFA